MVGTYGDAVISWAKRELGLELDPWQCHVLRKALRYDANGHFVHRTALWSTARQNGKSVIVRSFYGWLLDPEAGGKVEAFRTWEYIAAAAHDAKQARIIYKGVYRDLRNIKRLTYRPRDRGQKGERPPVYLTLQAGIQSERLTFDILTAEASAARGNSIGALAWDELLTQRDWEMFGAVGPTQSFQVSPIMLLTSTAGTLESVVLRAYYDRLRRYATGDEKADPSFYGAWWESEDPEAGLDWDAISQANPSPRLNRATIEAEYRNMPAEQWRRERLNHWADTLAASPYGPGQWAACRVPNPLETTTEPYCLGVAVGPDWDRATIVAAGPRQDGRIGVGVVADLRAGEDRPLTAEQVIRQVHDFPGFPVSIGFDVSSAGASAFRRDMEETGFPWDPLTPSMIVSACMDTAELVQSGMLAHDDPLLDAQVAFTGRRQVGSEGAFRFARSVSTGPIDAHLAMTFAAHAARYNSSLGIYIPA